MGMEGIPNFSIIEGKKSSEKVEAYSEYTFFKKTETNVNGKIWSKTELIPYSCKTYGPDSAYDLYVGWCLENNSNPLAREDLSINSIAILEKEQAA